MKRWLWLVLVIMGLAVAGILRASDGTVLNVPTWLVGAITAGDMVQFNGATGLMSDTGIYGSGGSEFFGSGKVLGWSSTASANGSCDTGFSRGAANTIYAGNCTPGDVSGTIEAAYFWASAVFSASFAVDSTTGLLEFTNGSTYDAAVSRTGPAAVAVGDGTAGHTNGTVTAAAFNLQSTTAGPSSQFFDDFYSAANLASAAIGSASAQYATTATALDQNHPGNLIFASGTGGTGTGIYGIIGNNASVFTANGTAPWTWESTLYVTVLPASTAGAYQAGITSTPTVDPWTAGIGFHLSSDNGTPNNWYCRYATTEVNSTVAATVGWVRLTMKNDGTLVHWYINNVQVCGTGVAVASIPSATQYLAYSSVAKSGTSVAIYVDYLTFQRTVTR
jgi:hypothetical protein